MTKQTPGLPMATRWARRICASPVKARSGVHPRPSGGPQRDDPGDVLRHQLRGQPRGTDSRSRRPAGTGDVFAPGGDMGGAADN
jgi:hypothetical protein